MRYWRSETGFSLVEVMVVVAIIGLMAGAVVLTLPREDTRLKKAAESTERAFIALARQSVLTGEPLGLRLGPEGFQPLKLTDDGWQPDDTLLKPEALGWAPAVATGIEIAGHAVDLGKASTDPQLWFLPTGEGPAFRLTLAHEGRETILVGLGNGRFEVDRRD